MTGDYRDPWRRYESRAPAPPRRPLTGFRRFLAGLPVVMLFWIVAGVLNRLT